MPPRCCITAPFAACAASCPRRPRSPPRDRKTRRDRVSELNDPELEELEGRLSRAFAGPRPRRGFEDELGERLERRGSAGRRWPWRRLAPWPAAGALAAVLVIGLAVVALPPLTAGHPAGGSPKTQTGSGA